MPKVQLPSGQIVSVPDELEGQAALDYLDEQERKLTPPGGMTRAAAGVYQGLAGYGEKAANVLERMGLPGQAATAQEFSSAMLDAPDVWQSKQHAPGIGGALAEMGGQLFADLPMIMGAMGAARVPLGAAETLTGRTILPRAGQTFMQQWPRVIGEAAVGGGMLEGATARPNVESAYAKGVEGAGEWALGAAILHPAFKTLGWAASKILGRLRGKPNMTPEMAASDPNLPMVLDRLQKGEKEADIIIDLTQRQGVWEAPPGGPSPPPPQVAGTQRRLPAPTADEYARAVTGELYREGPGGQGEMILETRLGRRKPAEEVPDVSLPYDAASAGVQGELPLSTRIRRRKGQAELPLQMRTTLPETRAGEEPSVIYSQKERRFTDKAQGVLPMEMGTGRIPGTIERGTLPETPPTESPLAPRPMTVEEMDKVPTQQLGLDFTGVTKMQVPKVLPSEMPFKVGQKVRYQGKTRKITGVKGKEFILDDMIAVPAADLKSVGGRRAKPTALESPILPEGEVTKPQGPFEKAPPPSGGEPINLRKVKVEVVEAPKKLVDDLRSVGYSDEFIATLVADHGIEGATTLYKARIAAISQKMKERDAQIRKALGQQVREGVPEEKLRSGEGAELDKSIKDDLINLADAIDDVETKAVAEGRPLTPQEEEEIVSAAVRTGIVPVQKAATNVTPKTRTAADLLRERLTLLKERGLAESEPVTITKTGQIRSKPRPKQSDEELLRLIEESEQDMRGELDHTDGIRKKYDEGDWDSLLKAVPFLLALPASAIASMLAPPEAHAMYGGLMAKAVPKGTRWFSSLVDMLPRFEFSDPVSWKPGAWEGMKQSGFFSADTQFDYKLSDLVNWPEGFLHYPDLDKIKVKKRGGFLDIFQTQKGAFFEESETLVISPFLDEAQALATLKHELQHYIQFVEGFTRGGSPKFIDWREAYEPLLKYYEDTEQLGKLQMLRERGPAVLEEVEKLFEMRYALSKQAEAFDASLGLAQKEAEKFKALNRELVKIREEFDSVYLNYNKLVELYGKGFTTNPEYKMIEAARKRVNKAADEAFTTYLEAVRRANSYRDRIRLLNIPGANSFIEKQKPLDDFAYDAYKLLGGEAEARDTVLRTLLTKAERESIMPMHMALAKGEELPRAEHLVKTMGLPGKPAGPYEKPVPQRDYLKALSAIVLGTGALALASDAEARTVFHGTHTGAIRRFLDKFIGSGEGSQAYGWGHYFTSKKAVAKWYADTVGRRLSRDVVLVGETDVDAYLPRFHSAELQSQFDKSFGSGLTYNLGRDASGADIKSELIASLYQMIPSIRRVQKDPLLEREAEIDYRNVVDAIQRISELDPESFQLVKGPAYLIKGKPVQATGNLVSSLRDLAGAEGEKDFNAKLRQILENDDKAIRRLEHYVLPDDEIAPKVQDILNSFSELERRGLVDVENFKENFLDAILSAPELSDLPKGYEIAKENLKTLRAKASYLTDYIMQEVDRFYEAKKRGEPISWSSSPVLSFFGEGAANRAAAFGSIDLDLSSRGKLEQIRKVKEVYKDLKFGDIKEKGPEKWLYTVELPDDLKLLDLDERLDHSQLEVIRDGLRNLYREKIDPMATPPKWAQRTDASKIAQVAGELSATIDAKAKPNMGHEYQLALQTLFGDRGASMFLRDYAGFKGNTYIGRTSGERNYVIFDEDIPQIREKEKGNAAVGLLATVLGLAGTAALGSYAYYKLRDFMEAQGRKADELKGMLQKGELNMPEVATAGLSGAGLSALKESIMRALEKTSMFQRSTNQTLEGGQRVTWAEQKAKINPLSEWFVDPSRMAERLGKDVSNWWADLMKADNITSYNFKNHATLFRDVEKTLTKEEQLRMRDILEGTKKPQTQAEEAAYGKLRSFYDEMWNKVVESRQKVYEQNLSEEEYGAFVKVFKEGASEEQVLKGMPREQAEVMKEIFKDYRDLQTKGKIEEYVTKHELGQYHLIEEIVGEDGKVSRRIVANAVSRKDALRKAKKYFEENPDKRSLVIDSNGMLYDLATALPRGSYYRVIRDLGKALKEDITWIEKELGKAVGNKSDIARRAVRRAFTLRPSEKFSPYLQERKDILKGEENIFDVLPAYAMSIEKKTNLDPLINEARRLLQGIDDPMGRQWLSNLIEDTKGRYWMSDRIVDTLLRNLNVEASPLAFSRGIAKIKQGEAMMKFAYRPVAAFINRLSGEGHTWVKFGTESFLDAKRFIKTPEGREFLKLVDPYMGVSYATDASGRIKPKESLWHPLGMFQAAEMPNRETTLAAAYLHALKNLGLNKAEAQEYAIRQNWFTQFTYNAASLPRILRTPVGRLLGQFKPYMLKEVEFIRQLGGQELVRYMAFQLAMGGPRGLLMLLKSLPLLGAWAALDDAEMWLNKHAARTSRGIGGALGVDVTAAATMQLPSRVEDWAGPFLSDLLRINKEVIQPMMRGEGGVARGAWKSLEGSIPIIRYWPELVIDRLMTKGQKDYIIKDDRGRELYRLQWPDYLKEAAGAEPLESSRIRVAEAILNRRQAATNKKKGQVIDTYVKALEGGQPVPPELIAEMQLLGVTPGSVRREARLRGLTPMQRRMLRTELGRRAMLQLEYPIEGE